MAEAVSSQPRTPYYDPTADIWPDLKFGRIVLAPVGVGVNAHTGAIIVGWDHTVQSAAKVLTTRYHERVLRRWVGSFVPHLLGQSAVQHVITKFFWAIASALDLWEPRYKITRVRAQRRPANPVDVDWYQELLTSAEELRLGHITFRPEGVYMPRGHLGNFEPERRRSIGLVSHGAGYWEAVKI